MTFKIKLYFLISKRVEREGREEINREGEGRERERGEEGGKRGERRKGRGGREERGGENKWERG